MPPTSAGLRPHQDTTEFEGVIRHLSFYQGARRWWKVQQLFKKYAAENAVAAMKICFAKQHVHEINLTSMEA